MAGMDMLLENAMKLLISKLPPETVESVGQLARTGVELKAQLDRIEKGQAELRALFVALVEKLNSLSIATTPEQSHARQFDDRRNAARQGGQSTRG